MPRKGSVKALSCPCCESVDLYLGPLGDCYQGVECRGCGLKMPSDDYDSVPASVGRGKTGMALIAAWDRWHLLQAIKKWNRREYPVVELEPLEFKRKGKP